MSKVIFNYLIIVLLFSFCSEPTSNEVDLEKQKIVFAAYSGNQQDSSNIYMMNIDGTSLKKLTSICARYYDISTSPNSAKIVFLSNLANLNSRRSDVFIMDLISKEINNLSNTSDYYEYEPKFTPDGNMIIFSSTQVSGNPQLFKININGTNLQPITEPDESSHFYDISPDGEYLVYHTESNDFEHIYTTHICIRDINGNSYKDLTPEFKYQCSNETFNYNGSKIYFSHSPVGTNIALYRMQIDGSNKDTIIDYKDIDEYSYRCLTSFPNKDNLMFIRGLYKDLCFFNVESDSLENITSNPVSEHVSSFSISGDGGLVIYSFYDFKTNNSTLYLMDILTKEIILLNTTFSYNIDPVFLNITF